MDRFWLAVLAGVAMLTAAGAIVLLGAHPGTVAAATVNVDVGDNYFANPNPGSHTTTINAGDTVHWIWVGTNGHSVTASTCPATCPFDDPGPANGFAKVTGVFDFTFNTPGTYNYMCIVHGSMTGTIVVQAAAATATPTNTSSAATSTPATGTATATRTATATGTVTVVASATPMPGTSTPAPLLSPTRGAGSAGVNQLPSTGTATGDRPISALWTSIALASAGASLLLGPVIARLARLRTP